MSSKNYLIPAKNREKGLNTFKFPKLPTIFKKAIQIDKRNTCIHQTTILWQISHFAILIVGIDGKVDFYISLPIIPLFS
jgi:hypothetical protein